MKSTSFGSSSLCYFFVILFIAATISNTVQVEAVNCVYSITVKTGTEKGAGTDSRISLVLSDKGGNQVRIPNLATWGAMASGRDYFENGNLDLFVVNAACTPGRICRIEVTSDNTGNKPGWFLNYIDVSTSSPGPTPVHRRQYQIYQWLATSEWPYQLSKTVSWCGEERA